MYYQSRSKNRNRRIAGHSAKKLGDKFQNIVKTSAERQGLTCEIIYDGAKRTGFGGLSTQFMPQPCDMILFCESKCAFIDVKRRNALTVTKSNLIIKNKKKKHNSSVHQLDCLFKFSNKHNQIAGFIVYLVKAKKVVFVSAKDAYFTTKGAVPSKDITLDCSADLLPLPDFKKLFT